MHESSLAKQIVEMALARASAEGARVVRRVDGWVAETEKLSTDSLRIHFERHAQGTAAEAAALNLRLVHVEARCDACGQDYPPDHHLLVCPHCGHVGGKLLGRTGVGARESGSGVDARRPGARGDSRERPRAGGRLPALRACRGGRARALWLGQEQPRRHRAGGRRRSGRGGGVRVRSGDRRARRRPRRRDRGHADGPRRHRRFSHSSQRAPERRGRRRRHAARRGSSRLRRLPRRGGPGGRAAFRLSVHRLRVVRSALFDDRGAPLRSRTDHAGPVPDVRHLRRRIRGPGGPTLSCRGDRVSSLRARAGADVGRRRGGGAARTGARGGGGGAARRRHPRAQRARRVPAAGRRDQRGRGGAAARAETARRETGRVAGRDDRGGAPPVCRLRRGGGAARVARRADRLAGPPAGRG